jgi:hypothetical protein
MNLISIKIKRSACKIIIIRAFIALIRIEILNFIMNSIKMLEFYLRFKNYCMNLSKNHTNKGKKVFYNSKIKDFMI